MSEVKGEQRVLKAACGSWTSPISAENVAQGALKLSQPLYAEDGRTLYWLEGRPQEGGRQVLVRRAAGDCGVGGEVDLTASPLNVRSLVHEYGGGAFAVGVDTVYFSNFQDQRLWSQKAEPGAAAAALSAEGKYRFADYIIDGKRNRLLAVMEDHRHQSNAAAGSHSEPSNSIVALPIAVGCRPQVLVSGADFYGCPRLSPDGRYLAYLSWNHPNMPWDGCRLNLAELDESGAVISTRIVAGGDDTSIFQPQWSNQGKLFFISEETGFWQPVVVSDLESLAVERLLPSGVCADCEFGLPMWVFGQSTYAVVAEDTVIFAFNRLGLWRLGRLDLDWGSGRHKFSEIESPYTEIAYLTAGAGRVAMLAGSASLPLAVVEMTVSSSLSAPVSLSQFSVLKCAAENLPPAAYLSSPRVIEFPAAAPFAGEVAYGFYYPPCNPDFQPLDGETPPLLVKCHGGPTGAASSLFSLGIQYWTSRGFAVVDVNYGGSTGFGRDYRRRLNGNWGVVDVNDCCQAARYLAEQKLADPARLAISGGSAGGYTVLSALTFTDTFSAGASHYGIGDLEALSRDTHKFESRYEDNLVAPYPEGIELYRERSPINHVEKLNCPVIFFQGLEDKVVPPNQAEAMVDALRLKGIAVAYIAYEGEQHGFRRAENIIRTIESEYYFFCKIFSISISPGASASLPSVPIENLF